MKRSEFYEGYKLTRDKSWDILLQCGIKKLPIDVFDVCKHLGIEVYTYAGSFDLRRSLNAHTYGTANGGFSARHGDKYMIFYEHRLPSEGRIRFTVAHEIGHIVMGHLLYNNVACRGGVTMHNNSATIQQVGNEEHIANVFASRLLAPACVLWGLNVWAPEHIASLCGLSKKASEIRAERMRELYLRNDIYKMRYNKTCFLQSPKERKVFEQFLPFINRSLRHRYK